MNYSMLDLMFSDVNYDIYFYTTHSMICAKVKVSNNQQIAGKKVHMYRESTVVKLAQSDKTEIRFGQPQRSSP